MSPTAPSLQTLRHLRRICANEPLATTPSSSSLSRTRTTHLRPLAPSLQSKPHPVNRPSTRGFSTTPNRRQDSHASSSAPPSPSTSSNSQATPAIPDISTYYTLFPRALPHGPPPRGEFSIPAAALRREFLLLQSQHHPDKYTGSASSHSKSLALSSLLNTAYKTLSDPLLRARYLLHHTYNIDITSEDNATHRDLTSQSTLLEVMEAQEAIEEAHSQAQIDALKAENRARIVATEAMLGAAFEKEDIEAAKTECVRLNYWRSLQQGLDDWEPGKEVRLLH